MNVETRLFVSSLLRPARRVERPPACNRTPSRFFSKETLLVAPTRGLSSFSGFCSPLSLSSSLSSHFSPLTVTTAVRIPLSPLSLYSADLLPSFHPPRSSSLQRWAISSSPPSPSVHGGGGPTLRSTLRPRCSESLAVFLVEERGVFEMRRR
jgi:hypothetical protein